GQAILARVGQLGADTLLPDDPGFPASLTTIPDPPVLLFAKGDLSLLASPAAALVGSRDHSPYGREACCELARCAARAGLTVVSGMARGLDAVAHQAALDAGGGTIGVLGNGLGVIYPAANRSLYQRVAQVGLLLSEFPPGERPHAGSFPRRNRLISGLARVTVVIEAGERSGTLITVAAALDQGRDVMAVPGPITSPTSVGTNRLIRDGAAPLLEPADLLALFDGLAAPVKTREERRPPLLADDSQRVYDELDEAPIHLDALADRLTEPVGRLLAILSTLELQGLVEQQPGNLFAKAS
ncbi:MAG: DNA-protecting protein DprA, partial [Gemmatimonadales bacterium]|nr:DNA-protecting protein DprA [Gemmatimonadales bacterium]